MSGVLADFHFLRPGWLALILLAPFLYVGLSRMSGLASAWDRVAEPGLLRYLQVGSREQDRPIWRWLIVIAWIIGVLAASGPAFRKQAEALFRSQATLVIAIDLSRSMLATDLAPDRISQARYKLIDLLGRIDEGQTGLVAYAGEAFVVSPLTDDAKTITAMVDPLHPDIMPAVGSEAEEAIDLAVDLIQRVEGGAGGRLLLITDSASDEAVEAARAAATEVSMPSVLGVGTPQGAPIPLGDTGVLKAADGTIVIAQLDVAQLQRLAEAGGGRFVQISSDGGDLARLLAAGGIGEAGVGDTDREGERWRDEGPWLVLLLLPLALLAFRRGVAFGLALVLSPVLYPAAPAEAASWTGLWRNQEQRAAAALADEDFASAARLAEDPIRRGNAYYRAGAYGAAAQSYAQAGTADGFYNQGNALARAQRYEEALAAYDEALRREPGMPDAEYNRKLVEDLLKEQQQQQADQEQSGDEQQESQSEDGQSEEGDQQQEQQQQQQQQQAGEGDEQREPSEEDPLDEEERQALEQWLRRIPDDPGGLLRRKFLLEYRRRGEPPPESAEEW